ncbi:hypothetical protein [Chryseobacterium populi]|uniref:Uncharacterized protein n=1 Tax=Chryseobacterium populi TaxID=1144316 RepID=J2SW04_9FLAO|nr:hypothetical protein [Chryseobacterium populi]EJL69787.1 hypothetical protein PMI13_03079 [Chryseobacterium populi]
MKNSQKKDELFSKFQNSKIERIKLDKISGGKRIPTSPIDVQTGLTSSGNHDNDVTPPDYYYDGTL